MFSGEFLNLQAVQDVLLAFLLFCVAASATYIVNDIRDIERDRQHPRKSRTRPLASGAVRVPAALGLLALLYGVLIWGWFVQPQVV
ncbi:MAG: UbiA family prenyltransferase, partial [Halothiobacillaceae bacterium]|nr:UbiA family prenyltransferase [Halothiobacillaceae bacterium]